MNLKVIGPRILVKVKKYSVKQDQKFENSTILMPEALVESETTSQTIGEIVQLGTTAFKRKDAFCSGNEDVKVGDFIHFARYGAIRINTKSSDDYEYWILMDKDVLVIETEMKAKEVACK